MRQSYPCQIPLAAVRLLRNKSSGLSSSAEDSTLGRAEPSRVLVVGRRSQAVVDPSDMMMVQRDAPLHTAVLQGDLEAVQRLLQRCDAEPNRLGTVHAAATEPRGKWQGRGKRCRGLVGVRV